MLSVRYTSQFKKDYKTAVKQGRDIAKMIFVIETLLKEGKLPPKFIDHKLIGVSKNIRECHIAPDWLLIYRLSEGCLELIRTGTHSDLF